MNTGYEIALIYTTCASREEAERLGAALVDQRLAACVNIFPGVTSIYVWRGQQQTDSEVAMLVKTRKSLTDQAINAIKAGHPYDTPALLVLDVPQADADYCAWVFEQTAAPLGTGR